MKEFKLIDKRKELFEICLKENPTAGRIYRIIRKQDKEFIRLLKEEMNCINDCSCQNCKNERYVIDKLAGDL